MRYALACLGMVLMVLVVTGLRAVIDRAILGVWAVPESGDVAMVLVCVLLIDNFKNAMPKTGAGGKP